MGVSVSAATAIIVAGLFVAFTAFYPVAANGYERVSAAERDVHDRALDRQNTAITLESATIYADGGEGDDEDELVVTVTNDGATGLVVSDTTLVVDNEYVDLGDITDTTVYDGEDGNENTDLWLPDETLSVSLLDADLETASPSDADRVVVVTESGVRDASAVDDTTGGS